MWGHWLYAGGDWAGFTWHKDLIPLLWWGGSRRGRGQLEVGMTGAAVSVMPQASGDMLWPECRQGRWKGTGVRPRGGQAHRP